MLHKGLPKNNKSARHNIVKSPDKGNNSAVIYNSINPQSLRQWSAHAGYALWNPTFLTFAGLALYLPLKLRLTLKC